MTVAVTIAFITHWIVEPQQNGIVRVSNATDGQTEPIQTQPVRTVTTSAAPTVKKDAMRSWISYTLKGIAAGVLAGLAAADVAAADGHISLGDGIRIAIAGCTTAGAVFGISNGPHPSSTNGQ